MGSPSQSADQALALRIAAATGADHIEWGQRVQVLWSGYGEIRRAVLRRADRSQPVIVKRILAAADEPSPSHPRGWNTDRSHRRKLRSYQVEGAFYSVAAARSRARVAAPVWVDVAQQPWCIVLEDLDAAGFGARREVLGDAELGACLRWLADFHAGFLGCDPQAWGLWPTGTYWHLDTRPDELAAMPEDHELRRGAAALDARLRGCVHQTLVHGDAKVANFCFAGRRGDGAATDAVAAVDFQYVGGGCGIQDVAYFLGSCLGEGDCERREQELLDDYFAHLRLAVGRGGVESGALLGGQDLAALEGEWRALYPVAWADFCRFLVGWAPDHRKLHRYSRRMIREGLEALS